MSERKVGRHYFVFNKQDNGGESVTLETTIINNGDGPSGNFLNQKLTLHSYCNAAFFELVGCPLTPALLRQCADELEKELNKVEADLRVEAALEQQKQNKLAADIVQDNLATALRG